ncbi:clathrin interactor EPSIN 3-like [Cucurbita maxima]|uniref:Clathrin interactor EPSIN 3-like n=1 Tax=Cucurbita maxima TaxID=3661 RepID=A0A6J1JUN9_CUCMA|nr:clathrin interactor EPSIN 3-like [Cucurbita maxima]
MKKVFGQTVRDIKREVNKAVLKVPRLEQKVLDATSNEPWGPHGLLLAEIAQASKNYHEYQMIMAVIWKRVNDSGKNWRHVYKGLTVLEYLVAHGSERVIDDIKDHSYQLSVLFSFQYIDSSGRDQGANVRKKSQSLVVLVNDPERISEIRQKSNSNWDKFRNPSFSGGAHRPISNSNAGGYADRYDDDFNEGSYGSRDEDRNGNGFGREREYDYRDDDRGGNSNSNRRDRDHYFRDGEERQGRDSPRDDDNGGRRSVDDHQYGARRDQDKDHHDSVRDGSGRDDNRSPDVRRRDHKFSEQNTGAPPSYEEAVGESRSPPAHSERDQESSTSSPVTSSAPVTRAPSQSSPVHGAPTPTDQLIGTFDEFDPQSSVTAAPTTPPNNAEMDLLGSLADFPSNPLAIMPAASANVTGAFETDYHMNSGAGNSQTSNQSFEDPFGDTPFKAMTSDDGAPQFHSPATTDPLQSSLHPSLGQSNSSTLTNPFQSSLHQGLEQSQGAIPETNQVSNSEFGNAFSASTSASGLSSLQAPSDPQFLQGPSTISDPEIDILADILPLSGPPSNATSLPTYSSTGDQPALPTTFSDPGQPPEKNFTALSNQPSEPNASSFLNLHAQSGATASLNSNTAFQPQSASTGQFGYGSPQGGATAPTGQFGYGPSQGGSAAPTGQFGSGPPQEGSAALTGQFSYGGGSQGGSAAPTGQLGYGGGSQGGSTAPFYPQMASTSSSPNAQANGGGYLVQNAGFAAPVTSQIAQQNPSVPAAPLGSGNMQHHGFTSPPIASQPKNDDFLGSILPQAGPPQVPSQQGFPTSTGSLSVASQPPKGKFETKSTVWADTLNRGLVDLNISGPKTNPLSDIGVDFDAINRKEKRMEKPTTTAVTSTITMGKAMGSGSGIGHAGAAALRTPPNSMMGSGMGMNNAGMGGGPYGGTNQPMGMGMGMNNAGMNPSMGMGMGMNNAGMNPSVGMGMGMNNAGMSPSVGMGMGMNNAGMNPSMGMGMGMNNSGMNPSVGMGMGTNNTGMNPSMGMGMNPGMGMGMNPGMGMNMGMGQGMQLQSPVGFQPGSNASGNYNPMMGGYAPQQSYGGGYQ